MVELADACVARRLTRVTASKLLFCHGHFERLEPRKSQPAAALIDALQQPSTSSQLLRDQYFWRRRRDSTGSDGGEDNLQQERIGEREESAEEEGDGRDVSLILRNFSILAEGILAIWEGEDSVRRRIEGLGERQQVMKEEIRSAEEVQRELRQRLRALEQQAEEEHVSLQRLKQERLHTLAQGIKACSTYTRSTITSTRSPASSLHHLHNNITPGSANKIACASASPTLYHSSFASSNDAAAPPVVSSRQLVAFEMLEFVHRRLTSHMLAHMWERVRSMQGEEERGQYLRVFRGIEGQSAFGAKPLSDATYTELLGFSKEMRGDQEVEVAMAAAEGRLVEEACKEGCPPDSIGDIKKQMEIYLRCLPHFKSAALRLRNRHPMPAAAACHTQFNHLPESAKDSHGLHPDLISDMQRAARLGKLGALQSASQLIQLGCYLLYKSSKVFN